MPENIRARVISILQAGSLFLATRAAAGILINTTDKELAFKKGWSVYMILTNSIPSPLNYFTVSHLKGITHIDTH